MDRFADNVAREAGLKSQQQPSVAKDKRPGNTGLEGVRSV
jgi:hypothetical protein